MHEYDKMLQWVKEGGGNRTISIEIGEMGDYSYIKKWAYDYKIQEGQHFNSIDEVDLDKVKEQNEYKLYEQLKFKFEKGV